MKHLICVDCEKEIHTVAYASSEKMGYLCDKCWGITLEEE